MQDKPDRYARRPWAFLRVGACLLAGLIGGVMGAVIGFLIGANYGGNYATEFEFAGLRGYEATGQIGAIFGFVTAGLVCCFVVYLLTRR